MIYLKPTRMYWKGLNRKEIKQMIERIKVAWYALTKKEYAFFSIQRHEMETAVVDVLYLIMQPVFS